MISKLVSKNLPLHNPIITKIELKRNECCLLYMGLQNIHIQLYPFGIVEDPLHTYCFVYLSLERIE